MLQTKVQAARSSTGLELAVYYRHDLTNIVKLGLWGHTPWFMLAWQLMSEAFQRISEIASRMPTFTMQTQ